MRVRNIVTGVLHRPYDTSRLQVKAPFVGLLYANDSVTSDEMKAIAEWLITSGCRYAVCAGVNCSEWHDAIDMVSVVSDLPEERFIMTSWHTDESMGDVIWFWLNCTDYDDTMFENYLALIVGDPEI